ncbi:hypothetical protein MJO28_003652 [Puccinia striiformis f. sp. tritici]|uniref:DNA replication regulator SLD2 n=2 Tax=Puccinia striiformis f. sp. tritici TaxID=168172 RepID=A0A0L0UXQ4_9BASI|nr:hypothetical protein Pst134EB_008809 [Puccinia striiformis f. sp. tritici]KAI9625259.1 hypothetical protein KEM48_008494 [Puccinia striiformis f. sp. tritici PST-130]KNE91711.1 hypothetical protein PSTG_14869 [Puccinia striiformis f. sp. tritici PST-78]KAI7933093.1 hypothetical protein MJO29_017040 [Puccinia striiformis f. sp. tritici]KAI7956557.1 hypothetical protein MJO28_003652 [Puccinia striiformis f. sp. tritici]
MDSTPSSSSSASQLTQLKTKLKTWERQFRATEGRAPGKADIKANPEIAKMYAAYNSSRKGQKGSDEPPIPSSSHSHNNQHHHHPGLSTPKSKTRSESLKGKSHKNTSQENLNISSPSKKYAHANSPSKIRKLVEEHSPRKLQYERLRKSQNKSTTTPTHLRTNPFDLDSGGGKGSPALFADLLLESKRDTPRTKARKFIEGEGSPFKPRSNPPVLIHPGSQPVGSGLSSFLKPQPIQSQEKSSQDNVFDNLNDDEDDEVLGPSPFKPAPNHVFQPLFDEPEADFDDHSLSPSKMIKSKWKINSTIPFVSQSQNHPSGSGSNNNPIPPQCAQKEAGQTGKKRSIGLGTKRKRLILPGEEDQSFYEDIPDAETIYASKGRASAPLLNKKSRSNKHPPNKNLNKKTSDKKTTKAQLLVRKTGGTKDSSNARLNDGSEEEEDDSNESGQETTIHPDLPFGNPDQSAVYTELETFTFTAPVKTGNALKGKETSRESADQLTVKEKGKSKVIEGMSNGLEPKPVALGTRKVLVRAYRPIEPSQMSQTSDTNYFGEGPSDGFDDPKELEEVEEEEEEEPSDDWEEVDETQSGDEEEEVEGEIGISEELMNILNVDDRMTTDGEDRRQLLRERRRERKVRKILDGMTLMEKTLTGPGPSGGGSTEAMGGKSSGRGKKVTNGQKSTTAEILRRARLTGKGDHEQEEEDLRFELALNELDIDQQLEDQVVDLDDDWDDEPAGWKNELLDPDLDTFDDDSHSDLNHFTF